MSLFAAISGDLPLDWADFLRNFGLELAFSWPKKMKYPMIRINKRASHE